MHIGAAYVRGYASTDQPWIAERRQERYQISFVFSSHDPHVIGAADDTIFLKDGVIHKVTRKRQEASA